MGKSFLIEIFIMAEKETKTELKKPESKKKEKLEPKQNWSSNEKQTSKDVYGCEILVDNGSFKDVSKTEYPNDAFIITYKVDDNLIKGCQSNVWLHSENNDGKLIFTADSDAILTKGIIAILIRVFSNQDPDSIMGAKTDFIDKIGLKNHLSPIRANGLLSMIKELKMYAVKSKTKSN